MNIFLKTINVNKKFNIILIIQIIILVFLIRGISFEIFNQYVINNYLTFSSELFYVSNCKKENDNEISKIVEKAKSSNIQIGYILFSKGNLNDNNIDVIYSNPIMNEIKYKLNKGKWLNENDESQVILGYYWKNKYKIGDEVKIKFEQGNEINCKIVGFLKKRAHIIKLNTASEIMDYDLLLESVDEKVVITNCDITKNVKTNSLNEISVIAKGKEENIKNTFNKSSVISMKKVKEISLDNFNYNLNKSKTYIFLNILLLLNSIMIIFYINYKNYFDMFKVYYNYGLSKIKIIIINISIILIDCLISMGIMLFVDIMRNNNYEENVGLISYRNTSMLIELLLMINIVFIHFIFTVFIVKKIDK